MTQREATESLRLTLGRLEVEVGGLLRDFEEQTGLKVEAVRIEHVLDIGGGKRVHAARVDVSFPWLPVAPKTRVEVVVPHGDGRSVPKG